MTDQIELCPHVKVPATADPYSLFLPSNTIFCYKCRTFWHQNYEFKLNGDEPIAVFSYVEHKMNV